MAKHPLDQYEYSVQSYKVSSGRTSLTFITCTSYPSTTFVKIPLPGPKMPVFSRLAVAVQLLSIIISPVIGAAATQQYDYVIVGGGITGLIVANRLTEDKSSKSSKRDS